MIGIFDSGSGGLTVLRAIRDVMPSADVIYLGDIKNAPYGSKSREELSRLTIDGIRFLLDRGAGSIVSACNSVSASLAVSLFDALSIAPAHLIEMVGPTVSYLRHSPGRILIAATPATIDSGIYQNAFRMVGKSVEVLPIPDLAGAIEFGKPQEEIERIVRQALQGKEGAYDVLVLACTHYPLVRSLFERVAGPGVAVFDPAVAVAERVKKQLWPQEVRDGKTRFVITRESEPFRRFVADLLPTGYEIEVVDYLHV